MKSRHTILADCELSTRLLNALTHAGYRTIGEVIDLPDEKLLRLPNFGRRCLFDLRNVQNEYLGTDDVDILDMLQTYKRRATRNGVYLLNEHLEMAILEIEHLRSKHE